MTAKEELIKLLMESYDRGVNDAKQLAVVAIEKAMLLEREACAKVADEWSKRRDDVGGYISRSIRARGNT